MSSSFKWDVATVVWFGAFFLSEYVGNNEAREYYYATLGFICLAAASIHRKLEDRP